MSKEIVGVVLSGGQSRRMGADKAFLKIGGIPLIVRVFRVVSSIFPTVSIVSKTPEKFCQVKKINFLRKKNIVLVQDLFEEQHALGGIASALSYFHGRDCFVFACDLPFLNPLLIRSMIQERNGHDLLVPKSRHGLEMLHALYTRNCLKAMEASIRQRRWRLEEFVQKVHTGIFNSNLLHAIDPMELSFLNVNTKDELRKIGGCA